MFNNSPVDDDDNIVQAKFDVNNLRMFEKCASLSTLLEIYLTNNYPMCIIYSIGNLGKIILYIAPIKDDNNENEKENYNDISGNQQDKQDDDND